MQRRRIVVSGRVQGVFYRDNCRQEASARGVAGWVRNRPDGTVEAVFEGEADAIEQLLTWARRGPAAARVDRVDVEAEDPEGLHGFASR